ncbi:hypothetical protein ABH899_004965 [Paenibacillus sp. RC84]
MNQENELGFFVGVLSVLSLYGWAALIGWWLW